MNIKLFITRKRKNSEVLDWLQMTNMKILGRRFQDMPSFKVALNMKRYPSNTTVSYKFILTWFVFFRQKNRITNECTCQIAWRNLFLLCYLFVILKLSISRINTNHTLPRTEAEPSDVSHSSLPSTRTHWSTSYRHYHTQARLPGRAGTGAEMGIHTLLVCYYQ